MKRITNGMIEAGVNALASSRKLSDQAAVAAIFSAMESVQRGDEMRARNDPPALYVHQSWPAWRYGPNGESAMFASADEVPEDWADAPAPPKAPAPPRRVKAAA